MDFSNQRLSYEKGVIEDGSFPLEPFGLLEHWLTEASENQVPEPYAVSLATCGADQMPSVRIVLVREITETGIIFYTNYLSNKGQDIVENPQGECLFFWHDMQRQVRVRGNIAKVSRDKTESYFQKRPYESQLGAWVSQPQSGVVDSRKTMDEVFSKLKDTYPEGQVPTPEFWGGYELSATEFEFWQGRANRLHDRVKYSLQENGNGWLSQRLLP